LRRQLKTFATSQRVSVNLFLSVYALGYRI
jgi:hypothetical protein